MKELKKFTHHQIDVYAKQYVGSPAVDELIDIKKRFDNWLTKREKAIHDYYAKGTTGNMSFKCCNNTFMLRIIFYKNGESRVIINHIRVSDTMIKDVNIISEYCVDAGSVYFIESDFGWKIGKATNLKKRRQHFSVKLPFEFAVRCQIKTHQKTKVESYFHNYFKDRLINGEWYDITDDDIIMAAKTDPSLKLSSYSPDDHIKVKYIPENQLIISNNKTL